VQSLVQMEKNKCPQCRSPDLVMDEENGEFVCSECGLVIIEDVFNQGPEWRAFTLEEQRSRSRTGAPIRYSRFDKGLHTTIHGFTDASGRPLSAKAKRRAWRLRKWQIRSRTHASKSRNLLQAMNELQILSEKLHVSYSIQEKAALIYRKALDEGLIRGRTIAAIVAASLYVACRFTKTPKTLNDIVEASMLGKREVSKVYRLLVRKLKIKMPPHDPLAYVSRIAEKAYVSGEIQGIVVRLLHEAKHKRITMGKDPVGVVAALLYIACQLKGENVTQKEIAEAAGTTEVTLRNRKKEIIEKLDLGEFKNK
jgi:transcription initiation factor TFIIB